jgi:hypothetical protein
MPRSFNGFELSDMNNDNSDGLESPWGGMSSSAKKRNNKGSAGIGSMKTSLLNNGSNSSSSPASEREPLRNLLNRPSKIVIDPKIICCTIFSIVSACMLILLGIYGAADGEGKYLILVEGGGTENGGSRGAQVGHIIGAAVVYCLFAAGCGFRWWKLLNGGDVGFGGRRESVINPSFD